MWVWLHTCHYCYCVVDDVESSMTMIALPSLLSPVDTPRYWGCRCGCQCCHSGVHLCSCLVVMHVSPSSCSAINGTGLLTVLWWLHQVGQA